MTSKVDWSTTSAVGVSDAGPLVEALRVLVQLAIDGQWRGRRNTSCTCHPEYVTACPDCGVKEIMMIDGPEGYEYGVHAANCARKKAIAEAEAMIDEYDELTKG